MVIVDLLLLAGRSKLIPVLFEQLLESYDFHVATTAGYNNEPDFLAIRLGGDLVGTPLSR